MKEQDIIEILKKENENFRKVSDEHHQLDVQLSEIDRKIYLTADEEIERKKMARHKLSLKDKMAEMIREYRKAHPDS